MTLIHDKKFDGPATHAIVIGVGAYKHLKDGDGPEFEDHEEMGQLTSPPISARTFAKFLMNDYNNPEKPLATLDLFISDNVTNKFKISGGNTITVERATMDNVRKGIREWKNRGDRSSDNLTIFFFCGHGVAKGSENVLLLEDFGEYKDTPFENAIDFRVFRLGMEKCAAREQCYFVDACRQPSSTLIESYESSGDPIIGASVYQSGTGIRHMPVFFSTMAGNKAYGRPDEPSIFTEVLLKAFEGAGSDNIGGDWVVDTNTLNNCLDFLLNRIIGQSGPIKQLMTVDGTSRVALHYLNYNPEIPVTIGCKPTIANEEANLSYAYPDGTNRKPRPKNETTDWEVELAVGEYLFSAEFASNNYNNKSENRLVHPPYRQIQLEVRK